MSELFEGLVVLDLSDGIAGPITTMMLADRGADVIRIERPDVEPCVSLGGERVWHRGKRSAELDLRKEADREILLALVERADVLVESFSPGRTRELGIDYATLAARNARLVHASITGYGRDTRHANRPACDQLVAARTGLQWECRGWYGSPMERIRGLDRETVEMEVPETVSIGSNREGPIFTATPAPSIITAYQALLGISAALRARDEMGYGQWVETSMLQAAIMMSCAAWQRTEKPDGPGYSPFPVSERRQTWGILRAKDGFVCTWASKPEWFTAAGAGSELRVPDAAEIEVRGSATMPSIEERLEALEEAAPILARFDTEDWVRIAAECGEVSCQPIRTPEQALCDAALLAEGSVTEVEDPELGPLRQVGAAYRLHERPIHVRWPAPLRGAHTAEVKARAESSISQVEDPGGKGRTLPRGPMEGIRILDFGGAVAGPWAAQLLADLGADVIKVDPKGRLVFFLRTHMGIAVNRGKRWVGIDAKTEEGAGIVRQLVEGADVVVHNMRPQAAEKLGLDYGTLSHLNPRLVYCHTRGFEDGRRSLLPGNDQTGNALGGSLWEDGGCWEGGRPWFGAASNGDLGNGYLAAIAIVQALYDRERTGRGQRVDASILNASLVNNSRVFTTPAGRRFERPKLDRDQRGFSALYRLYRCRDEWICLAVLDDAHWQGLCRVVPRLGEDERFASADLRERHDGALAEILAEAFADESAAECFEALDRNGVPCEISSPTFSREIFEDEDLFERGWLARFQGDPLIGDVEMFGLGIDFSATPGQVRGPIPMLWQHTREVLAELGYDEDGIARLVETGAVVTLESA
jgi:crotonobetainyl-CoA:carnitine CoA-transferase CaiB-like acyl-CoA transferase